jgi:hypothetical protein
MRKRVYVALAVVLVALISVVDWQLLRSQEREPVYQGKRLSVWLHDYSDTGEVTNAVRQTGTNAIPTLLKMLRKKDSSVVCMLRDQWGRHISEIRYLPVWFRYPDWFTHQAVNSNAETVLGFHILGADARQAVPTLVRIYEQNISLASRLCASDALFSIGPAAGAAVPSLLRGASDSNEQVRVRAVAALWQIHPQPSLVVPAFAKSLDDTKSAVREMAATALGDFGADAQQAVPALVLFLSDSDAGVRECVTNALLKIDPEAAAKAGVK